LSEDGRGTNVWAFYPLMVVPGIVLLLAPASVESIMNYFHFHESLGGLIQVAYFAGGFVGIISITRLMQRFDVKQIALSQVLLLSVSLLAASFAPWYPLLLAFYLVSGIANGILIAFPGVYVTNVSGESSHQAQNILYSFFALGVLSGPLLVALVINHNDANWRWAFRLPALLILPLALPVAVLAFRRLEGVKAVSRGVVREILDWSRGFFIWLLLAIVLYIAAEAAVSMWLITFLKDEYGVRSVPAHWTLTALWAGLVVGRWICAYLSKRIDPFKLLTFLTVASALTLLVAPLTGSKAAALVMYPVLGLFYSGIYPFLIAYASWFPLELSGAVFTIFVGLGAVGGAVLPYLVGLVNQFAGVVVGMSSISIAVFGVLVCLYGLRGHVSERPAIAATALPGEGI
jgi:FHS family glucose/mannose:H+ symporter-like MFS transporter